MKIGTKGHYAVAAMVELAKKTSSENPNKPISLGILAETQNISANYLELLFAGLKKRGLVKSIRGAQGGYLLACPAFQINVLEILTAVGEGVTITRCKTSSTPQYCFDQKITCTMHAMWKELEQTIHDYLSHISLESLSEGNLEGKLAMTAIEGRASCGVREQLKAKNKIFISCSGL